MSGRAVRRQFVGEFRNLRAYSRTASVAIVGSYIAQILISIATGHWILQNPITPLSGVALAIIVLFVGTRLRALNNIVHECSHFSFCDRRNDNVVLGSICASVILTTYRDYRDEHMTHHAHLGDYDQDRDLQGIRDLRLEDPLTPATITRHILTVLSGRYLPYYVRISLSSRDGALYAAGKIGLLAAAVAYLVLDPLAAIVLVWLPFVWVFTAINYMTDCVDHGGVVHAADELQSSRNVRIPRAFRPFLFPRNDCFHLVHHLFPQVPARHLEACHNQLLMHPDYREATAIESGPEWGEERASAREAQLS